MNGFQVMPRLSAEEYELLEQDILANGVQVPIVVATDGRIIDGHHRDEIARKHDKHCPRTTASGSESELRSMAFRLNINRRHFTREQKRELIAESLKADPQLTDREHSRRTGTSPTTVGTLRSSLEGSGEVSKLDTRRDPRGYDQPASKARFETVDTSTGELNPKSEDGKTYSRPEPKPEPAQEQIAPKPRRKPLGDTVHRIAADVDLSLTALYDAADDRASTVKDDVRTILHRWHRHMGDIEAAYGLDGQNETPAETGEGSQ